MLNVEPLHIEPLAALTKGTAFTVTVETAEPRDSHPIELVPVTE
jgi:hypothetical protein